MGGFDDWDREGRPVVVGGDGPAPSDTAADAPDDDGTAADGWDDDPWDAFEAQQRKARQARIDLQQRHAAGADAYAEMRSTFTRFSQQLEATARQQAASRPVHTGSFWSFTREELQHLGMAMGAFTLALAFALSGGLLNSINGAPWLSKFIVSLPLGALAVGPAFLLHEFGHKFVARHYGCWAEFRADPRGLQFGVVIAAITGFLFMAPGAVMVSGMVTRRQNGNIAIAGPMVNLALVALGVVLFVPIWAFVQSDMLYRFITLWILANLGLGLLNMLPFGPLDGRKVKYASEVKFWTMIGIFVVLIVLEWNGGGPLDWIRFLGGLIGH